MAKLQCLEGSEREYQPNCKSLHSHICPIKSIYREADQTEFSDSDERRVPEQEEHLCSWDYYHCTQKSPDNAAVVEWQQNRKMITI